MRYQLARESPRAATELYHQRRGADQRPGQMGRRNRARAEALELSRRAVTVVVVLDRQPIVGSDALRLAWRPSERLGVRLSV